MLIQTITNNTEETMLNTLEASKDLLSLKSFLQCSFSDSIIIPPDVDSLIMLLKDLLSEHHGVLYYCNDKDIFIEWTGSAKGIKTAIEGEIAKYCLKSNANWNPEGFFQYYDMSAHGEELRIICKHKIAKIHPERFNLTPIIDMNTKIQAVNFTADQYATFAGVVKTKHGRVAPEVLIVEDQAFSRTLMKGILIDKYKFHVAKNGAEAISLYAQLAPDITLLDVELPDMNGHDIAKFIRRIDPAAWIIMVTGNHYQSDVIAAKENKVQGFIVKPYNKQKILEMMDIYNQHKKKV